MTAEMNSVDKLVAEQIRRFPTVYRNRISALASILCTNDHAFYWGDNGEAISDALKPMELVEPFNAEEEKIRNRETLADLKASDPHFYERIIKSSDNDDDESQKAYDNADTLAVSREYRGNELYWGQIDGCMLESLPENITPEWREACEEIKPHALWAGWYLKW